MLPTFIIAGAGKAGTTTLWSHLNTHPQVCMARIKEPAFFSEIKGMNDNGGSSAPTASGSYSKGLEWYKSLFATKTDHKAFGEASTLYMHAPDAAGLIKRHIPNVKLIFILRDPVARMYSQYWQERKAGMNLPPFTQMLNENHPRIARYENNSHYHLHLERFLSIFPRHQMLVLFTEQLSTTPQKVLNTACNFINIESDHHPSTLHVRHNPSSLPRFPLLQQVLKAANNETIKRHLPTALRQSLSKASSFMLKTNQKAFSYPPLPSHHRANLIMRFLDDITFAEQLTGTSLDHWRSA